MTHTGTITIYCDRRGEWRWRLSTRNGRIIADSAEGYKGRRGAVRAVASLCRAMVGVRVKG